MEEYEDGEDVIVRYEPFEVNMRHCIRENEDGSISIKDFSQVPIGTMTAMCYNKYPVTYNRNCLFYCMPCIRDFDKKKKYPSGTVTSIRWNRMIKGNGGGFFEVPMLDVWNSEKRVNVKLSSQNIHITGAKSMKSSIETFDIVSKLVVDCYDFWLKCQDNEELFLESADWVATNSRNIKEPVVLIDENGKEYKDTKIKWPVVAKEFCPDVYFCREIISRSQDLRYSLEIIDRCFNILESEAPTDAEPEFENIKRSMVNYVYYLYPTETFIDLKNVMKHLKAKGYHVTYHVTSKREINITILDTSTYDDDHFIGKNGQKFFEQSIYITFKGIVKHSGPGGKRHERWYKELMQDLISILF